MFSLFMGACLTHCILVDSSTVICRISLFVILGMKGLFCRFIRFLVKILLANNVEPDQTPHNVASDLGLHCLPTTLSWSSTYERVYNHSETLYRCIFFFFVQFSKRCSPGGSAKRIHSCTLLAPGLSVRYPSNSKRRVGI